MRRLLMVAAAFLFVLPVAGAQGGKILVLKEPEHPGPPIGVQLRQSVVLIQLQCEREGRVYTASGTGFVAAYPAVLPGKELYFDYLVTNRHIALCWDDNNRPMTVRSSSLRLNKKDGSSQTVPFTPTWYLPDNDSVDLAVSPITIGSDFAFLAIPLDLFATKDFLSANRIAEGAQIILSGYFYQFPGEHKFQPIVRQGILSMIPDEPVITTTGKRGEIYLGNV